MAAMVAKLLGMETMVDDFKRMNKRQVCVVLVLVFFGSTLDSCSRLIDWLIGVVLVSY